MSLAIRSLRDNPHLLNQAQSFLLQAWADEKSQKFYEEVLQCSIDTASFIPHFLFALLDGEIVGCVGVALQDFVSCADIYPFLIALYVAESYRKRGIASALINQAKSDCQTQGFANLYLCTDLCGFYEHFGFVFYTQAHDIFGYNNRIYQCHLNQHNKHTKHQSTFSSPHTQSLA